MKRRALIAAAAALPVSLPLLPVSAYARAHAPDDASAADEAVP